MDKSNTWQLITRYCAYQERSHQEARTRLLQLGERGNTLENYLVRLIEENYLNEQRFAIAFAGGKFRMKQWGRIKIKHALQQQQVSPHCIEEALQEIPEIDYREVAGKLIRQKWMTLDPDIHPLQRLQKLRTYLLQKGYEPAYLPVEPLSINAER